MNWKQLIADLLASGMTYRAIASRAAASLSTIHDIGSGKTAEPFYSLGCRLKAAHAAVMRAKKARQARLDRKRTEVV